MRKILFFLCIVACSVAVPVDTYRPAPGEWITVPPDNHYQEVCCGCGLSHDVYIEVLPDGSIRFKKYINKTLTDRMRKTMMLRPGGDLNGTPERPNRELPQMWSSH